MALVTELGLWELLKHVKQWLTNLGRANARRKRESIDGLRAVILAARSTSVYLRRLNETATQDHSEEAKLAGMWTELGFRLTDLGLHKLAKRCDITGRYWADPKQFDAEFLHKADVSLVNMERLARMMVADIEASR